MAGISSPSGLHRRLGPPCRKKWPTTRSLNNWSSYGLRDQVSSTRKWQASIWGRRKIWVCLLKGKSKKTPAWRVHSSTASRWKRAVTALLRHTWKQLRWLFLCSSFSWWGRWRTPTRNRKTFEDVCWEGKWCYQAPFTTRPHHQHKYVQTTNHLRQTDFAWNMACIICWTSPSRTNWRRKNAILIVVFMNMFTDLVVREQLRLEAALRPFINEQPILMPYVHVLPPLGGWTLNGVNENCWNENTSG